MVKNLPAMQDTWVQCLGGEDPLEKDMATHSSTLAWIIPWTEEPGGLQFMRLRESDTTQPLNQISYIRHSVLVTELCPALCGPMDVYAGQEQRVNHFLNQGPNQVSKPESPVGDLPGGPVAKTPWFKAQVRSWSGNQIPHASTNIEDPEYHNLFGTTKEINKYFFKRE